MQLCTVGRLAGGTGSGHKEAVPTARPARGKCLCNRTEPLQCSERAVSARSRTKRELIVSAMVLCSPRNLPRPALLL